MFYEAKINKNIDHRSLAKNYCDNERILMDGIWLMNKYPKPILHNESDPEFIALQEAIEKMGDIAKVKDVVDNVLDNNFDQTLQLTPVSIYNYRALYNEKNKQFHFVDSSFLEMVNLNSCIFKSTNSPYDPVILENRRDKNQWLLVMPIKIGGDTLET